MSGTMGCSCGRPLIERPGDMEATCAECQARPDHCDCQAIRSSPASGAQPDAARGSAAGEIPPVEQFLEALGELGGADRSRRVHEVIRALAARPAEVQQSYRDALVEAGFIRRGDWREALSEAKRVRAERERENRLRAIAEAGGDLLSGAPGVPDGALDITEEPEAVRLITEAINEQRFSEVFLRGDVLTQVTTGENAAVLAREVNDAILRRLIADNLPCIKRTPHGEVIGALPLPITCKAILALQQWPKARRLRGIANFPVPLLDGTILQQPGYHSESGLYLPEGIGVPVVPDKPTAKQVQGSLDFLTNKFLRDFPWCGPADKANALGALLTPLLREIIRDVFPFGVITAPERGSGKTLLAELISGIYNPGAALRVMPADEKEIEKTITSALRGAAPVIVFDNVAHVIKSPSLAALLTMRNWTARILGGSRDGTYPNDRLWICTGTNVMLGGDFAQRSFRSGMDYGKPNPDMRTGFAIEHIKEWAKAHRGELLWYLLVLIRAWQLGGAERDTRHVMRGFTPWAQVTGGVLAFHGIDEFLANRDEVVGQDDEAADMARFIMMLHTAYGDRGFTARQILDDVAADRAREDAMPPTLDGGKWTPRSLGKLMASKQGQFYGKPLRTLRRKNDHSGIAWWRVAEWVE